MESGLIILFRRLDGPRPWGYRESKRADEHGSYRSAAPAKRSMSLYVYVSCTSLNELFDKTTHCVKRRGYGTENTNPFPSLQRENSFAQILHPQRFIGVCWIVHPAIVEQAKPNVRHEQKQSCPSEAAGHRELTKPQLLGENAEKENSCQEIAEGCGEHDTSQCYEVWVRQFPAVFDVVVHGFEVNPLQKLPYQPDWPLAEAKPQEKATDSYQEDWGYNGGRSIEQTGQTL